MDVGRVVGVPYRVEWVDVDEPDHDDDTDNRTDRVSGFTPNRIQAQDNGAARQIWVRFGSTVQDTKHSFFYESASSAALQSPDNIVVVPATGDIFLQEDGSGVQFIRGVTLAGEIYDFAQTGANDTEFCGGCFDPDGQTFYANQQGDRGNLPGGPVNGGAVTYAIYGPSTNEAETISTPVSQISLFIDRPGL